MAQPNGALARIYSGYVVVTRSDGCLVAATRQLFATFDDAERELNRIKKEVNAGRWYDILCFGQAFKLDTYADAVYCGACPDEGCSGSCVAGWCDQCGEDYIEKLEI